MAVYEHLYGAYEGVSHSAWSRFLVIPRYALRDVFKSKLFTTIFILCFIYPLAATIRRRFGGIGGVFFCPFAGRYKAAPL